MLLVSIALPLLALGGFYVLAPGPVKKWDLAWAACEGDDHQTPPPCATIQGVCGWEAVNRAYIHEAKAYYRYIGPLTDCPAPGPKFLIPSPAARCRDGKCVFEGYNK